jgi:hypothetical protein
VTILLVVRTVIGDPVGDAFRAPGGAALAASLIASNGRAGAPPSASESGF